MRWSSPAIRKSESELRSFALDFIEDLFIPLSA